MISGMKTAKRVSDSRVIMTEIVLPTHTNALGTIFGGEVMSWIDIAAAISSGKHARKVVVTASVDALHFLSPIRLGEIVSIEAQVNHAWKTSMEVGVHVEAENLISGEKRPCVSAFLTFVALDEVTKKPCEIPELIAETVDEKKRQADAIWRREDRLRLKAERPTS